MHGKVHYTFKLGESERVVFEVDAGRRDKGEPEQAPEWTKLRFRQCGCCPLKDDDTEFCPAATRICELMEAFGDKDSTEIVEVTVQTDERSYFEKCDLQVGINSLLGLMMATSGCPVLRPLGPMANFHIPFCTTRETLHRTVGSYLIKQYFEMLNGREPDWELRELKDLYGRLEGLNRDFSKRIQACSESDAVTNAAIMFFATSVVVASSLDEQLVEHQNYLTNAPEKRK